MFWFKREYNYIANTKNFIKKKEPMYLILLLLLLLAVNIIVKLWRYIHIPSVVTMIALGIIINIPIIRDVFINTENLPILKELWNIGIITLMFIAWIGSSIKKLKKETKEAFTISVFAFLVPFILTFLIFNLIGSSILISIIVGICLSISAEWTTVEVLYELKRLDTKIWSILLEAGIIDDIIGILFFISIVVFLHIQNAQEIIIVILSIFAFFVWAILKKYFWRFHKAIFNIEKYANILIIPFFFINIGLQFDTSFQWINYLFVLAVLTIAIWWKIAGTLLSKKFVSLKPKELLLIGSWLNSRWAIWLAIAYIIYQIWLIPSNIYWILVIISLITTLIFPFIAKYFNNKIKR